MTKRKAASDLELLGAYVSRRSQEAFCTLVERHLDMVYGAALRRVGTRALAEDVTQAVFIVLAQKAPALLEVRTLGGWLLRVTRCASVDAIRKERARSACERRAARGRVEARTDDHVLPLEHAQRSAAVDEALARLTTLDRETLLLRFYQDATYADIGISLGITEEAARKRSDRALVKLRKLLARRGGLVLAAILPAMWLREAHAAPAALTRQIMRDLTSSVPAAKLTLAKGAIKMMTMQTLKLTFAGVAACVVAAGAGWWVVTAMGGNSVPPPPVATEQNVSAQDVQPPPQAAPSVEGKIEVAAAPVTFSMPMTILKADQAQIYFMAVPAPGDDPDGVAGPVMVISGTLTAVRAGEAKNVQEITRSGNALRIATPHPAEQNAPDDVTHVASGNALNIKNGVLTLTAQNAGELTMSQAEVSVASPGTQGIVIQRNENGTIILNGQVMDAEALKKLGAESGKVVVVGDGSALPVKN
ncbi:MAG TPA: sigma-70 family RNA polymerase sigma factor [Phycisphaerae bacterium]